MLLNNKNFKFILIIFFFIISNFNKIKTENYDSYIFNEEIPTIFYKKPILNEIFVNGLKFIPIEVINNALPITKGIVVDEKIISKITKSIYLTGYFTDITIKYEFIETNEKKLNLHIFLKEKYKVTTTIINGNSHFSEATFEKKLKLSKIAWIDLEGAQSICKKMKKLYEEKGYNKVSITPELIPLENGTVNLIFKINEGLPGRIQKVSFIGNKKISKHKLKEFTAAKEYWILGMFDNSGIYRKDITNFDKYQIENFYKNNGFYEAFLKDTKVNELEDGKIEVLYEIYEGPIYKFGEVVFPKDSLIPYFELRNLVKFSNGEIYSQDKIRNSINAIKNKLGEIGFMYPEINPKIKVNREKKTVDVEFFIENGKPIYVRKINIKNNTVTKENIIRREITFGEGDLLTTKKLDDAKRAIESLGFFAPKGEGVNWEMKTVDSFQADLDLFLYEVKTGKFYFTAGINNASIDKGKYDEVIKPNWYDSLFDSTKISLTTQNINFRGKGIKYYLNGAYAKNDHSINLGTSTNWLFEMPLSAAFNASYRGIIYDDFKQAEVKPHEINKTANFQIGFRANQLDMTLFGLAAGIDVISYKEKVTPKIQLDEDFTSINDLLVAETYEEAIKEIISRSFQPGTVTWSNLSISNDKRNHPVRPTEGYSWTYDFKLALPLIIPKEKTNPGYGFIKTGIDFRWYTPLIIKYNTVLHIHGYAGLIKRILDYNIPYKELYHVGGSSSVRGYYWGQISPSLFGSSLGASKTFFTNIEIQTPINKNGTIMANLFYDGGAGWETLFNQAIFDKLNYEDEYNRKIESIAPILNFYDQELDNPIKNNNFSYRHSVGFGISLTAPMPIKIEWGFKLDRKRGEKPYEVHISMEGSY